MPVCGAGYEPSASQERQSISRLSSPSPFAIKKVIVEESSTCVQMHQPNADRTVFFHFDENSQYRGYYDRVKINMSVVDLQPSTYGNHGGVAEHVHASADELQNRLHVIECGGVWNPDIFSDVLCTPKTF